MDANWAYSYNSRNTEFLWLMLLINSVPWAGNDHGTCGLSDRAAGQIVGLSVMAAILHAAKRDWNIVAPTPRWIVEHGLFWDRMLNVTKSG